MKTLHCLVLCTLALLGSGALGQEKADVESRYEAARQRAANETYDLRYKFVSGETLRWKVVHRATTETTIQGNTQTSQSRSISTKVWKVTGVDAEGNITFVHMVSDCDMWKKVSGHAEESYNSRTDKEAPLDYEAVAATIGKPISTVTIDHYGNVQKRIDHLTSAHMAHSQIALPMPKGPVKIGHEWYVPDEVVVRMPDRRVEKIHTRQRYRLLKVETGVATIDVETQVLTPVDDPKVRSQLLQQLVKGTIKFDVDAGRLLSKQLDWDETVISFNGPESLLKFLARGTEELLEAEPAASPRTADSRAGDSSEIPAIRRRDGAPIFRR